MLADVHHHALQALLQCRGHVFMVGVDGLVGSAARDQVLVEIRARGRVVFALFAGAVQLEHGNADGAVGAKLHGLGKKPAEARRVAVRREAHDLVLVGVEVEAEMEGDERVKNADGIVGGNGANLLQLSVVKVVDAQALHLAHGVVDDDEALIPAGGIGRAGGVRQVMADLVDLVERKARQIAAHLGQQGIAGEDLVVEVGGNFVAGIEAAVGSVVESVRDLVDFVDGDAGLSKAELGWRRWESRRCAFCR